MGIKMIKTADWLATGTETAGDWYSYVKLQFRTTDMIYIQIKRSSIQFEIAAMDSSVIKSIC